jgi:hypothetical protein
MGTSENGRKEFAYRAVFRETLDSKGKKVYECRQEQLVIDPSMASPPDWREVYLSVGKLVNTKKA